MQDKIAKAKAVKARFEQDWISKPEVVSVGIGMVQELTPGIIIGVKTESNALRQSIPDSIEGVQITLQTVGEIKAL